SANICAARMPALVAPALPMATVATGIPAGICTIESSESRPCSDVEGMGTPITGSVVSAAITPARCAAPPAPATITRIPRLAALRANSLVRAGERCAEAMSISYAMPKPSSALATSRMTSRSESLPITIATRALFFICLSVCQERPRSNVVPILHTVEMNLTGSVVRACQGFAKVERARADIKDASAGGDDVAVAHGRACVKYLHPGHTCGSFQAGNHPPGFIAARIAAGCEHDAAR